jgi:hypothetical protein
MTASRQPKARQKAGRKAAATSKKTCTRCGEVKPLQAFAYQNRAKGARLAACRACERARVRRHELRGGFPATIAAEDVEAAGGLRAAARAAGFASGFEREVFYRLRGLGVWVEREGLCVEYRGADGGFHRWTPDFTTANDVLIEAKGRLYRSFQDAFADVLLACPRADFRFVFQDPHKRGQVEGSDLTPAQWADARGLRWGTLDDLDALTADLPRVRPAGPGASLVTQSAAQKP